MPLDRGTDALDAAVLARIAVERRPVARAHYTTVGVVEGGER